MFGIFSNESGPFKLPNTPADKLSLAVLSMQITAETIAGIIKRSPHESHPNGVHQKDSPKEDRNIRIADISNPSWEGFILKRYKAKKRKKIEANQKIIIPPLGEM